MRQSSAELVTKRDLAAVEEKLIAKIEKNSRKIEGNSRKIEENGRKIEENSRKIDRLTLEVLNNREEITKLVSREEFQRRFDDIIRGQDKIMTILTRWDAERTAILARIERLEQKA